MKHLWKIIAAVIVVLLLIIVAIRLFVNVNTFRPKIEQQLSAAIGRKITLGNLSLSVLAGNVVADNLSIADDPTFGTSPFLTASTVKIGVQMKPLIFDHQLLIRSIQIDSPRILLIRASNGLWNFSTIGNKKTSHAPKSSDSVLPNLSIGEFDLKDGTVTVADQITPGQPSGTPPRVYSSVQISMQNFSFDNPFPFDLKASLPADGSVHLSGKTGPLNTQNAALTPIDAQLQVKNFDPVADGFLAKSAGVSLLADIDANATSVNGIINSTGTIHTKHMQLMADASPTPKPVDITYSATYNLASSAGELHDAAAQTGKITTHLSGTYDLAPATSTINMKLSGQSLPIDEIQGLLPAVGVHLPNGSVLNGGTLTTNLLIAGPVNNLIITGPVELNNTRLAGFNPSGQLKNILNVAVGQSSNVTAIQTLRANLQISPTGGTRASNIFLSLPAIGQATGSGVVSPSKALNFHLRVNVENSRGVGGQALGVLSSLGGKSAQGGIPVAITGTTSAPVFSADVKGYLTNNATSILKNPKNAGDAVQSLSGLLGGKKH
jgi:AsmA protein